MGEETGIPRDEIDELNERVLTFRMENIEKKLHNVQVAVNLLKSLEVKLDVMEKRLAKVEDAMRRGVVLDR